MNNCRKFLWFAVLAALLCGVGCVFDSPSDIPLAELEEKMQRSVDPDRLSDSIESYVQRQSLRIPGFFSDTVFRVELKYKKPGRMKIDTYGENKLLVSIIFNGGAAWIVKYPTREVDVLYGEAFDRLRALNHLSTPGVTYSRIFSNVELCRTYQEGEEFYKLTCRSRLPETEPFFVYVSPKDYRVKRVQARFLMDGKMIESDSKVGSYALMEGIMVPQKVYETQNGMMTESTVSDYRVNVILDDEEFLPPIFERLKR